MYLALLLIGIVAFVGGTVMYRTAPRHVEEVYQFEVKRRGLDANILETYQWCKSQMRHQRGLQHTFEFIALAGLVLATVGLVNCSARTLLITLNVIAGVALVVGLLGMVFVAIADLPVALAADATGKKTRTSHSRNIAYLVLCLMAFGGLAVTVLVAALESHGVFKW